MSRKKAVLHTSDRNEVHPPLEPCSNPDRKGGTTAFGVIRGTLPEGLFTTPLCHSIGGVKRRTST